MLKYGLTRKKKHAMIKANQERLNKRLPSAESLLSSVNREKKSTRTARPKIGNPVPSHKVTYAAEKGVIPLYNTEVTQLVSCFAPNSVLR